MMLKSNSGKPFDFHSNILAVSLVAKISYDGKLIGNLSRKIESSYCPMDEGLSFFFVNVYILSIMLFSELDCVDDTKLSILAAITALGSITLVILLNVLVNVYDTYFGSKDEGSRYLLKCFLTKFIIKVKVAISFFKS